MKPHREKNVTKMLKIGRDIAIFFQLKIAVTRPFFKILRSSFLANIPNFITEMDSEIKIGC